MLLIHLPANVPEKVADASLNTYVFDNHMVDTNGILGSWILFSPVLADVDILTEN